MAAVTDARSCVSLLGRVLLANRSQVGVVRVSEADPRSARRSMQATSC